VTGEPCPFCEYVVRGKVAFTPLRPATQGHTLVVPRRHVQRMPELDSGELFQLWVDVSDEYDRLLMMGAGAMNVVIQDGVVGGQSVEHLHVHVVPRRAGDGLGYRWGPAA
jgi:diadenosine tetraphosphate (Ap4A) HIT family hydrolase